MGIDSKLFVTCGKENTVAVGQSVRNTLNVWIRKSLDKDMKKYGAVNYFQVKEVLPKDIYYTNGVKGFYSHDLESFTISFGCGDDMERTLWMHTDCSVDYNDAFEGDKIIFSIGCWGMYEEIMKVVADAVRQFGDVYYDKNDSDAEGFVKIFEKGV